MEALLQPPYPTWLWVGFSIFVLICLLVDLFVLHKEAHKITIKESLIETAGWIVISLLFGVGVYYYMGGPTALDYYTGYLIEKSLSVDNIFVFVLIFGYFKVPDKYKFTVLYWGIFGALVFRFIFIFLGAALLEQYSWFVYIFGVFLIYTAYTMIGDKDKEVHPENNPIIQFTKKFFSVSDKYHEDNFFIRHKGKLMATPMFIVLVMIETTDIVFALDSIPAILSITTDKFIVFSSNAFAILGLRALYFALDGVVEMFHYLHYGLAAILGFVGIKFLISGFYHVPTFFALGFIALALIISVGASLKFPKKDSPKEDKPESEKEETV